MSGVLFIKSLWRPSGCHTYNVNRHKWQYGCIYTQTATICVRFWVAVTYVSANTHWHDTFWPCGNWRVSEFVRECLLVKRNYLYSNYRRDCRWQSFDCWSMIIQKKQMQNVLLGGCLSQSNLQRQKQVWVMMEQSTELHAVRLNWHDYFTGRQSCSWIACTKEIPADCDTLLKKKNFFWTKLLIWRIYNRRNNFNKIKIDAVQ